MPVSEKGLTPKQQRFVEEYLIDLNATAAYRRTGFTARTEKTATVESCKLLANPSVAAAVQAAIAARTARTEITQDRVLEELATLSFSNLYHYKIDDEGNVQLAESAPASAIRAVSSIKKRITTKENGDVVREAEIRLWDKPATLQMTAKHLGMLTERSEQTHKFDLGNVDEDDLAALEKLAARLVSRPS